MAGHIKFCISQLAPYSRAMPKSYLSSLAQASCINSPTQAPVFIHGIWCHALLLFPGIGNIARRCSTKDLCKTFWKDGERDGGRKLLGYLWVVAFLSWSSPVWIYPTLRVAKWEDMLLNLAALGLWWRSCGKLAARQDFGKKPESSSPDNEVAPRMSECWFSLKPLCCTTVHTLSTRKNKKTCRFRSQWKQIWAAGLKDLVIR